MCGIDATAPAPKQKPIRTWGVRLSILRELRMPTMLKRLALVSATLASRDRLGNRLCPGANGSVLLGG
jgi:hypothetical protein